ncbi:unnamed protein product [Rotaria magnacalcarata]|uniref:YihY/virulence factor BrkB family protein n=1 Tax=Rotaria magnacalcarata TaxID=392030 RepID=A0A816RF00_9BILA|nr:unnamed protein product [Rotaria magnacalcarata]CAF2077723.1 unnamed protein product [Rotaria magnacalcarata]CAF4037539.1 unnamed protein product [Rotaria magnacalcarata]CAF4077313.1 unnamed protein product [Rotaria magnacalcarata]
MINNLKSSSVFREGQQQTKPIRHFLRKFQNDWSMDFSAMLAYNLLITLLPIAVALFGILGLILKNYPVAQNEIKDKIIHLFPADNTTQAGMKQVVDLAFNQLSRDAGLILAIGIFFALFGSSRLFIAIDKCMTIVYRLPQRTFLRQNTLAFGMLFLFITIIPVMLAASSAPSVLISIIPGGGSRFGTFFVGIIFSLTVAFILFESIYWLIPNKKMSFKITWCGALVAACTLEVFIILFPLYVRRFMGNYAGQIGFAVILLLFFYYFATILILGAQINAFFFDHYKPLVEGLGTYISQMHQEHGVGDINRPLCDTETDKSHHLPTTTTTADQSSDRKLWWHKLWSSKNASETKQEEEQDNIV